MSSIKLLFDQVIRERKIHYDENNIDFLYTRKLDDQISGKEYELTIHMVSPFNEHFGDENTLKMHSIGRNELLVILPADKRLMQDLLMYKRTEKYIIQNTSTIQQETKIRILESKGSQNRERHQQLETRAKELVARAKLFVAGDEMENGSTEPVAHIVRGFHELIRRTYPNLKMLKGKQFNEADIETYLKLPVGTLPGVDLAGLNEAEQEILTFVQSNNCGGLRTTFKSLDERFEHRPYGWSLAAVQCNLALLCAHSKVEIRSDGNLLEGPELAKALRNTQKHANVIIEPQVEFSTAQVRMLKEFFEDFFDCPPESNESRDLGKETGQKLQERLNTLVDLTKNQSLYPFLSELTEPITVLKEVIGKSYTYYLVDLNERRGQLLDLKENTIAPILSFWHGPQKTLYDEARLYIQSQATNFDYIDDDKATQLRDAITDKNVFRGSRMQQVRTLLEAVRSEVEERVRQEKQAATGAIRKLQERVAVMDEVAALSSMHQTHVLGEFNICIQKLRSKV